MTKPARLTRLQHRWAVLLVSLLAFLALGAAEGPEPGPSHRLAAPEGEDDAAGEEEEKDYWASVKFDRLRFREIQEMVRLHYIDPGYDRAFAFQRAASFALASLEQGFELLPTAYLKAGRKKPDLKKKLAGKTRKLRERDQFVVLEHVKGWDKDRRRRMSDDEIRAKDQVVADLLA